MRQWPSSQRGLARLPGRLRYLWATVGELRVLRRGQIDLSPDGRPCHQGDALFASALNMPTCGSGTGGATRSLPRRPARSAAGRPLRPSGRAAHAAAPAGWARTVSACGAAPGVPDAAPGQRQGSAAGGRRRAAAGTTCVRGRGASRRAAGGAVSILQTTPAPRAKRALRAARPGGRGTQSLFLPLPWPLSLSLSLSLPLPLPLSYLT